MDVDVLNESGKIENRACLSPGEISVLLEHRNVVYVQGGASNACLLRENFQGEYR